MFHCTRNCWPAAQSIFAGEATDSKEVEEKLEVASELHEEINMRADIQPQTDPEILLMHNAIAAIRQQVIAEMKTQRPAAAPTRRLLTAKQAGDYLGRSEAAIRQMVYKRQIAVVRFDRNVRFDIRDLDALINDCRM